MRVVFLGTPDFAVPSLKTLLASRYEVCAVFTQPDRPGGRGQNPQPPPIKTVAAAAGVAVYQPAKIRADENRAVFESLRADFLVVVAYGQILPGWLLKSAAIAPVNVHASLLPRYRGAAPVVWAILRGETITGVTTMLMDESLDTGKMLLKSEMPISEDSTGGELAARLSLLGASLVIPTLDGLANGTLTPEEQDHALATWAPRIVKDQARLSWESDARELHNLIRAFNPWPRAFCNCGGQRLLILKSRPAPAPAGNSHPAGHIIRLTETGILVACGQSTALEILEVQPANRRIVAGKEFAHGARIGPGAILN
jgi:methionyl-tRNA formyltransferase